MPNYETYADVLRENTASRNVFGSSVAVLLMLAVVLLAVSVI